MIQVVCRAALILGLACGLARGDEKVEAWAARLAAPTPEERIEAAFALGAMGEKASPAVEALSQALGDKLFKVRAAAAIALGKIGPRIGDRATQVLLERLDDLSPSVRRAAAKALIRLGEVPAKRALETLLKDLAHERFKIRTTAAETLGSLGLAGEPALEALRVAAAEDKSRSARFAAAEAAESIAAEVKTRDEARAAAEAAAKAAAKALAEAARERGEAAAKAAAEAAAEAARKQAEAEAARKRAEAEAQARICKACEEKNTDPLATNCSGCGDSLLGTDQGARECPGCGQTVLDTSAKVCADCGTAIPGAQAPPAPAPERVTPPPAEKSEQPERSQEGAPAGD